MQVIALLGLLAVLACTEPDRAPADRPLPLFPGGTTSPGDSSPPPATDPTTPDATEDRCLSRPAQDVPCVDADLVAPLWTLEAGYVHVEVQSITDDVNGDGLVDATLHLDDGAFPYDVVVVYGPLVRKLVLPRDADLHVVESDCWWGDWTGDAVVDGLCNVSDYATFFETWGALGLVEGPLPRVIDPDADRVAVYELSVPYLTPLDTDFDGLLEAANLFTPGRVEVWRGDDPATWMVDPPDLTLQFHCDADIVEKAFDPWIAVCNDDEGDGVRDLAVGLSPRGSGCEGDSYLVPAGTEGFVDLASSPLARKGSCLASAGDQDLDGVADFDVGYSVKAGPITWTDGVPIGPTLFDFYEDFPQAEATGVDFTDDGIDDWWDQRWDPGDDFPYVILSGGADGGVVTGIPSWHVFSWVEAESAYTEDGTNYVVFTDDAAGVRFVPIE